jgi:hypothetical protein
MRKLLTHSSQTDLYHHHISDAIQEYVLQLDGTWWKLSAAKEHPRGKLLDHTYVGFTPTTAFKPATTGS